ncbi:hypothetical protein ACHWQZ_G008487 [Mnemiopsis leidyi]
MKNLGCLIFLILFWNCLSYDVCRTTAYLKHYCPDNFECCGDDGIHCCLISNTWKYVLFGILGFIGLVALVALISVLVNRAIPKKVDFFAAKDVTVDQLKQSDRTGAIDRLRRNYQDACCQEDDAWHQEKQNAEDGLQKQRIELDLAESRAKIASEILEKAQKNQEDAIHIDQALQRKIVCDGRVLKTRILWDLAIELTKRDALTLGPIIEKATRKKINEEERILKWAREILFFLEYADALERALEGGSYEELCNILAKIKDLGFEKKCARLVFRAKLKTERIEKFQHLLKAVLEMNHMQMQDLIDYSDPDEGGENPAPDSLMRVLQAIAKLLGGEEECWMELQAMVTRMGEGSLKRRAMSCEVEVIPPQIITEVSTLLKQIDDITIQEECPIALPMYKWCQSIVEERFIMNEEQHLVNQEKLAMSPAPVNSPRARKHKIQPV